MKNLLCVIFFTLNLLSFPILYAQGKLDTIYYNKNWERSINSHFAEYKFVTFEPVDTTYSKEYQCFYRNGEIHSEGAYTYIDRQNALNNVYDINRTVYSQTGDIREYYEYKNSKLDGSVIIKSDDGSIYYSTYTNGIIQPNQCAIEYPNGTILKYDPINNIYIKDIPTSSNINKVMSDGLEWQFYNLNGIVIGVCVTRINEYGKYVQVSLVLANYTPHRFDFGVNNINCEIEAYDKKNKLRNASYANVLDKEQYLKMVKNRQIWNEIGASVLLGLSSAVNNLSGAYDRTINTNVTGPFGNTQISTTYYSNAASMLHDFSNAIILANQHVNHKFDLQRLSIGYLSENTIFPNSELSGHIMIPEEFVYSGMSKPHWKMNILIEIDGVVYPFSVSLGEFWAGTLSYQGY